MERLTREMTFEEVKEQWKKDFNELRDDIKTLIKNLDEFEEQVNQAKNLEDLGYLSDCFDIEKGLKHISIFNTNQTVKMTGLTFSGGKKE